MTDYCSTIYEIHKLSAKNKREFKNNLNSQKVLKRNKKNFIIIIIVLMWIETLKYHVKT